MKIEHKLQTGAISVALLLSVTTAFLYVHDTMTGDSLLASALDVVGFCPYPVTGATGPAGATGATGTTGNSGAPGVNGSTGSTGAPGKTGSNGAVGSPGATGSNGSTGSTGAPGVTGATGAPGTKGDTGEKGDTGKTGETGAIGSCLNPVSIAAVVGDLVPALDNVYTLGTATFRWKGLQLGPGTLFIEDKTTHQQAGITIDNGTFLIDGVQNIRLGNIQITSTGIRSVLSNNDITIGAVGDTGYLSVATGIRFSDGSTMLSAPAAGATGAPGPPGADGAAGAKGATGADGAKGATGPAGPAGTILPYGKQYVCVVEASKSRLMYWGTCASNNKTGSEYWILATLIP